MLYVILGTDRVKSRAVFAALRTSLEKKHPDAAVHVFDADTVEVGKITELIGGMGLFDENFLVVLDGTLIDESMRDVFKFLWKDIAASENVFVVYEEKLDATTKKLLEGCAETFEVYDAPKAPYHPGMKGASSMASLSARGGLCSRFSTFDLADAVASRDKKRAWTMLMRAQLCDIAAEEMHGTLFWQVKMMCIAKHVASAGEADMKPFVYEKAKRGAGNFTDIELRDMSGVLVRAYHESHRGGVPLYDAVETLVLAL